MKEAKEDTTKEIDFSNDTLERLILKTSFVDKNWINTFSKIFDKRWFKSKLISVSLKLIVNYFKKYGKIPNRQILIELIKFYIEKTLDSSITVANVLQLFLELDNMELGLSKDILNRNIKLFLRKKMFYNSLYDNAEILEKNPDKYEEVVEKCLDNFDKALKIIFNDNDLGLDYFNEESMKSHWEFINNPEAKIKTGWESVDDLTNGGLLKDGKMLALIMAQAGLGKSVFLSNMAINFLKQNLSVVVISLEMSQDVYAERFDAHISNSNINKLKDNQETAIQKIKNFYAKYPKANLYVKEYPPRSIRPSDIQLYLENLKNAGKNFDVVIIDYLNLVLALNRSDNMYKDGLEVSEKLRALSYMFGVPVISAVQSNTEGMNSETIGMENVSESRGICHTADFLAALYQTDDDRANSIINMRILKNRLGGRVGSLSNFTLNPETLVLSDVTFDHNFNTQFDEDSDSSQLNQLIANQANISSDLNKL